MAFAGAGESSEDRIDAFIHRWEESGAAERANFQLFASELCQLLRVDQPEPARADAARTATPPASVMSLSPAGPHRSCGIGYASSPCCPAAARRAGRGEWLGEASQLAGCLGRMAAMRLVISANRVSLSASHSHTTSTCHPRSFRASRVLPSRSTLRSSFGPQ